MGVFDDRTVLITGAASGIGRALAERFHAAGATLLLWDINGDALATTAATLGDRVATAVVDVSDQAAVSEAAQGHAVDILVNNAGVVSGAPLLDTSPDDIRRTFAVNTLALYWTTQAFLPGMIARGRGHVVTIASASGFIGAARLTDYAASKHAAVGFDESLRMEMRHLGHRIDTTVVCPYFVDTGMFDGARSATPHLLPFLNAGAVADRILNAVRWRHRRVLMPSTVGLVFFARYLPVSWFDWLVDRLGINHSMDEFRGRD